jgi:hypothetical protein
MINRYVLASMCVLVTSCVGNGEVVVRHRSGEEVDAVVVTLSRDAAGRTAFAQLRFERIAPGVHVTRPYSVGSEYYLQVVATLSDGTRLTSDYGYVIDEEWRPMRQEIEVFDDSIKVNGEGPDSMGSSGPESASEAASKTAPASTTP